MEPSPSPEPSETTYRTYEDPRGRFGFEYPDDWYLDPPAGSGSTIQVRNAPIGSPWGPGMIRIDVYFDEDLADDLSPLDQAQARLVGDTTVHHFIEEHSDGGFHDKWIEWGPDLRYVLAGEGRRAGDVFSVIVYSGADRTLSMDLFWHTFKTLTVHGRPL